MDSSSYLSLRLDCLDPISLDWAAAVPWDSALVHPDVVWDNFGNLAGNDGLNLLRNEVSYFFRAKIKSEGTVFREFDYLIDNFI